MTGSIMAPTKWGTDLSLVIKVSDTYITSVVMSVTFFYKVGKIHFFFVVGTVNGHKYLI